MPKKQKWRYDWDKKSSLNNNNSRQPSAESARHLDEVP